MKNKILLGLALLSTAGTMAQTLTLDAESGNRSTEQANCWGFGATSYTNNSAQVLSGSWSIRGNSLSNSSLTACWIKSPWITPNNGDITLTVKMENTSGLGGTPPTNYKMVSVRFISFDPGANFGEGDFVSTQQDHVMSGIITGGRTRPENITFTMPAALVTANKPIKIMFSFSGNGGNNRPNIDDVVIPGTYYADPANSCLPQGLIQDADNDGVPDPDDAYPNDPYRAFNNYLPTSSFNTLMFEDLWPGKGDYDFNDLVVDYKINRVTNANNQVVDVHFTYKVKAIGAAFKNGLGVEFTGVPSSSVYSVTGNNIRGNVHTMASNGLEAGTNHLTFIAFDNATNELPYAGGGVVGVNTTIGAPKGAVTEKTVTLSMMRDGVAANGTPVSLSQMGFDQFNPFLIVNQIRGREVHLADKAPTALANLSLFNTSDDASNPGQNIWYKSKSNFLPWAINVPMEVPYPAEKVNIQLGYPQFRTWVESNGTTNTDWYLPSNRVMANLYQ